MLGTSTLRNLNTLRSKYSLNCNFPKDSMYTMYNQYFWVIHLVHSHADMYGWVGSMDIYGYLCLWISMNIQQNIDIHHGYPYISMHTHSYPSKIFRYIQILYPKIISLHYQYYLWISMDIQRNISDLL